MQKAAIKANVQIVTGDTKVVDKGKGDKIFINTSGIGIIENDYDISSRNLQDGDKIIINGTIADHGITILSQREGLTFESDIISDTASLNNLVESILECGGNSVHAMRDPSRGGVAATLNEFASNSKTSIIIDQSSLPVNPAVIGAAEILGIDPLYIANEGKIVVAVASDKADEILAIMKKHPDGKNAAIIGSVNKKKVGLVTVKTLLGSERILDMPVGEQLPRIC
ncbi:MAG: hydrogenase expression/formation protein HypE [Candidatus Zixiibacteriota bacterium]|nr:MAG: hydrogenase expression/formation protein HypE [candidate division Zixibacteria bacterium]